MMQTWDYTPSRTLSAKLNRRIVQWRAAAPAQIAPDRPVVSFTFDDFPKSAVAGADSVEKHGGRAGFYATTSFMGMRHPDMGEMFDASTLSDLISRGHEIGAHTHSHLDCAKTDLARIERDVGENLVTLAQAGYSAPVSSFAYPYGETSWSAKRWTSSVFATARGVLPGVNMREADRAQLRAVELDASEASRRRALAMLEICIQSNGWLIFFTHDVSPSPSAYGAPPSLIEELAQRASDQGAVLAAPTLGAVLSGVIN